TEARANTESGIIVAGGSRGTAVVAVDLSENAGTALLASSDVDVSTVHATFTGAVESVLSFKEAVESYDVHVLGAELQCASATGGGIRIGAGVRASVEQCEIKIEDESEGLIIEPGAVAFIEQSRVKVMLGTGVHVATGGTARLGFAADLDQS